MSTELWKSISRIDGVKNVGVEVERVNEEAPGIGDYNGFSFDYRDVTFESSQIRAPRITVNKIQVSFVFPTFKKQDKAKLYAAINSFNKNNITMKAVLGGVARDTFEVTFSAEFMCPDTAIVDEMTHPIIKVLRNSGTLLVNLLGGMALR
ncbi:hypothetical protein ICJ54_13800 [Pseudomonas asiatica]|uniref:hypothetical protein n=1 Tax=Pseudomonas asiatica TaxID=2219225 RepID=UPI0016691064|nr:hypothetical protein [Pseudomonas asiatica]QNT38660.1 hypothetical protein ICJ54_13800 [Pseudomonas asiatica]